MVKKRLLRIFNILIVVVCGVLILWQVFGFFLIHSNGSRTVVVNDYNRQTIEQLISQNIETDASLLDMNDAINVEWQSLMHKDRIVINYAEKDAFVFYITNRYENSLIEQIKSNGKVVYFESKEFVVDVVKTFLYSFFMIFATIILVKQKVKKKENRYDNG